MSLKGGRKIVVGGFDLRWKVAPRKDASTNIGGTARTMLIVVQGAGRPLIANIESQRWPKGFDDNFDMHKVEFGPGQVKAVVDHCLKIGWDPSAKQQFNCPPGLNLGDWKVVS